VGISLVVAVTVEIAVNPIGLGNGIMTAGQALRPWIGGWVERNRLVLGMVDRGSILIVVYAAFSEGMVAGIWHSIDAATLARLFVVDAALLVAVLVATTLLSRRLGFSRADASMIAVISAWYTGHPVRRTRFCPRPMISPSLTKNVPGAQFTFTQPVQIPGRVLPAGTYRFQLADNDSRHLVQIFREDRTLVATLYSIPRLRDGRSADAAITLADRGAAQPQAIVAWFFGGETQGHELLYARQGKQALARATQTTFMSGK